VNSDKTEKEKNISDKKDSTKAPEEGNIFQLGEVVVTERSIASVEDAGMSKEITGRDIEARSDRTLDQALRMVPGIRVYEKKGNMVFEMRGISHSKMAILIDGVPIEDIYMGQGVDIAKIPVMNGSKINVNTGVCSALYGALGTVGSINVVSKKPEEMITELNLEYGIYNNNFINFAHGAPVGDFYYWITGSMMTSLGYEVSEKLDYNERKKWFDKLVQPQMFGVADPYSSVGAQNYFNDSGKWDHSKHIKYQTTGKIGYHINDNIEAAFSSTFYINEKKANYYSSSSLAEYNDASDTWSVNRSAEEVFKNKADYYPEDFRYSFSPYCIFDYDKLYVRLQFFYVRQLNSLEQWLDIAHTSLVRDPSVHDESSYGFSLYPSYRITSWNKLSMGIMSRVETLDKKIKPQSASEYQDKKMKALYLTFAIEDEIRFKTPAGEVSMTAGISWDAQDFRKFDVWENDGADKKDDVYLAKDNSAIWGTRDSVNPVLSVLYEPLKDFLRIRSAMSLKTEFPSLKTYRNIGDAGHDVMVKPERAYNANAGFELFFLDKKISFRNDYFYTRTLDKIEKLWDSDASMNYYTNIDAQVIHGFESTLNINYRNIFDLFDVTFGFTYVYLNAQNEDNSTITYGDDCEESPKHQIMWQVICDFVTGTTFSLWGNHTRDEFVYIMISDPTQGDTVEPPFSRDFYAKGYLHNPLKLNIKLSQRILENYEVYVMCKNILDDYNSNPFNPGPGRIWYFGAKAQW